MKKVLFLATLAVALVLTSCDNGLHKLPKELRKAVKEADKEIREELDDDDPLTYEGVSVEDNDIIFTVKVKKDELDGKSLKAWMKKAGITEKEFQREMRRELLGELDEDDEELFELLVKHKYNIVFRFVGKDADDKIEAKISYKDLPQYKTRDRSNLPK